MFAGLSNSLNHGRCTYDNDFIVFSHRTGTTNCSYGARCHCSDAASRLSRIGTDRYPQRSVVLMYRVVPMAQCASYWGAYIVSRLALLNSGTKIARARLDQAMRHLQALPSLGPCFRHISTALADVLLHCYCEQTCLAHATILSTLLSISSTLLLGRTCTTSSLHQIQDCSITYVAV